MRLLIAGGGTGGHIYIGIAIARELRRRDAASEVLFVGTRRGLESRIVPGEGFQLEYIESTGLKRVGAANLARGLLLLPRSLIQSYRVVGSYRPNVAVGVGGFSSGPAVLAAWLRSVPTLVVEPNAYPGLANRWLAHVVDRAAIALEEAAPFFRGKAVLTGIPVRSEFKEIAGARPRAREGLRALVYGGSQGSHALNMAICNALPELAALGPALRLTHQTGERELAEVRRAYREAGVEADIRPFLPRIYEELADADLVVSRAGAGTVAELTVAAKPALLVPFPGAADDHQTANAEALRSAGAAILIPERELTPKRLASELRFFLDHPEELERMSAASKELARPDAAERIVDLIAELAGK